MAEKLLVVDDDRITRRTIRSFLNEEGYEVVLTEDGTEALESFCRDTFDLVVTDFVMSGMDGLDLTHEIHAIDPETPVIMMSGHHAINKANAVRGGADDFIQKPILLDELLDKIKSLLNTRT